MARKAVFTDKMEVVNVLRELQDRPAPRGKTPASYFLMQKLVNRGLVNYEKVREDGERPRMTFTLAGKGKSYLALAKNWK